MATIKIELKKCSYGNHSLPVTVEDYKEALELVKDKIHRRDYSGKYHFYEEEHILEIIWNTEAVPGVPEG